MANWGVFSHYRLDEASGTRSDEVSTNHLTDNNTVTSAAGKIGLAAVFAAASSEYLSSGSDDFGFGPSDDFWMAGWIKPVGVSGAFGVAGQGAARDWDLFQVNNTLMFNVDVTGTATSAASLSAGVWAFFMAGYDATAQKTFVSINGASFSLSSAFTKMFAASTDPAYIGTYGVPGLYFDGALDSITFGKNPAGGIAAIRESIRDRLYNSGDGRDWPPFVGEGLQYTARDNAIEFTANDNAIEYTAR